jgi:hypothetical protein
MNGARIWPLGHNEGIQAPEVLVGRAVGTVGADHQDVAPACLAVVSVHYEV